MRGKRPDRIVICLAAAAAAMLLCAVSCAPRRPEIREATPTGITFPLPPVRVLLVENSPATAFSLPAKSTVALYYTHEPHRPIPPARNIEVSPWRGGLSVGGFYYPVSRILIIPPEGKGFSVNGRNYPGRLAIIRNANDTITLINHVPLQDYLSCVIGGEMPLSWPEEALKAQAVAARTWVLRRMQLTRSRDFDVYDDERSQVYSGLERCSAASRVPVAETRGEVLTWEGGLFFAYYHSACGGRTWPGDVVMGDTPIPPLGGTVCPFCGKGMEAAGRSIEWTRDVETEEAVTVLTGKLGMRGTTIKSAGLHRRGVIPEFRFTTEEGAYPAGAVEVRSAFGLKAPPENVVYTNGKLVFTGRGAGHRAGLCQWGAYRMAIERYYYREILDFYYPSSEIVRMSPPVSMERR